MEILKEIQHWYLSQCDGEWEHTHGFDIQSLDNPGWRVKIDVRGTLLESREFKDILRNVPQKLVEQALGKASPPYLCEEPNVPNDWLYCFVKDGIFEGVGDSTKLEVILKIFVEWMKT